MAFTAKIIPTEDGSHTLFHSELEENYHSKQGAIGESAYVYISNGLLPVLERLPSVSVLEIGFGTGLNAFLSLLEAEKHQKTISYTGIEMYPVPLDCITNLNYSNFFSEKERMLFLELHTSVWNTFHFLSNHFQVKKVAADFTRPTFEFAQFDLIYFDAFAPQKQPELWTKNQIDKLFNALKPGGILVSYCAQSQFKRTLKEIGFSVGTIKGFGRKREMTLARKD